MKILLLGKDGQIGGALQSTLPSLGNVVAWGRQEACFENLAELAECVAAQNADVIVNAAAYTAVDMAESHAQTAFLVNAKAVSVLAAVAARQGALMVHYSTDYVFDGKKADAYDENDAPNPLSVYGRSKLAGDEAVVASGCRHLIFRVSWIYAPGHANFPGTMLRLARQRSSLNVVGDQIGAPTSARLVASATAKAIAKVTANEDGQSLCGLYSLAATGAVSRADMVRFIIHEASALGAATALPPETVRAVSTSEFPTAAMRPLNSRLGTTKIRQAFGVPLPSWQDEMRAWVACELAKDRS